MFIAAAIALSTVNTWPSEAWADDRPHYGPAPSWVDQVEIPGLASPPGSAAVRSLLEDIQDRYLPEGKDTYFERADRIQTPQGLEESGTIVLDWNPDTETLTVNKLKIIRGNQTIDILASGQQFMVLRRENNLDRAMLDGTLSAVLAPEGLQVGDVLDLAFTRQERDPVTRGASARIAYLPQNPTGRFRIREVWPASLTPRWQKADELAEPKLSSQGGEAELVIDMADTQPLPVPAGAPDRFSDPGRFEFSLAGSWADIAATMAPLYRKASELPPESALHREIDAIKAGSDEPKMRAAAALRLVQDKVRYLFLGMDNGGFRPSPVGVTWARRFGDCKAKTVLLVALLRELGIEAEPALVNMDHGDGLDQRLPAIGAFDHVITRATIDGKIYWLDGTRTGDRTLDDVVVPPFKWALPLFDKTPTLQAMVEPPPEQPSVTTALDLDASGGFDRPAPAHAALTLRGDTAVERRLKLADMTAAEAEQFQRSYWKREFDFVRITKVAATWDEKTGEERMVMDGTAKMDWKTDFGAHRYEADRSDLGWKPDFDRAPGPYMNAPYSVPFPYFHKWTESIILPDGGAGFTVEGRNIAETIAGREFRRTAKIENGVFAMEAATRSIASEFPAAEADNAKAGLLALRDASLAVVERPNDKVAGGQDQDGTEAAPKNASLRSRMESVGAPAPAALAAAP
jgi:transglutaminase-like putative cysteine protease